MSQVLCFTFYKAGKLFFKVDNAFPILPNSVRDLHVLVNTWRGQSLILVMPRDGQWHLTVVLIDISLTTTKVKYFFHLPTTCVSSLVKHLFRSFAYF